MTKRVFKLTFLISLNVNGELVVKKVRKDGDSIWYVFDDDHQDPDLHVLLSKRVKNVKLKKIGNTTQLDHYFTETEYKHYVNSDDKLVFKDISLSSDTESSDHVSKRLKGGLLDYHNLNYIDFFKRFDKETVGLSSSEKFRKLENLVADEALLNNIKIAKFSTEWSLFYEKFERLVNIKFSEFIIDGESKKFEIPGDLTKFSTDYFQFCKLAYPKSTFRDNLTRLISKMPKIYAAIILKIKCDDLSEFVDNLPMLNALIARDQEKRKEKSNKNSSDPKGPLTSTTLLSSTIGNEQSSTGDHLLDFTSQDVSNVSTHVKSAIDNVVNYFSTSSSSSK